MNLFDVNAMLKLSNKNPIMLELPWPPSVNTYWKRTRVGMRRSSKANQYIKQIQKIVHESSCDIGIDNQNLHLHIELYPPDKRKRDIDNILKALLDALEHAQVYNDDYLIDSLYVKRHQPDKCNNGMVFIKIEDSCEF